MTDKNDASKKPRKAAARRSRSKPKFEVPTETGSPQEAGWVYRESGSPVDADVPPEPIAVVVAVELPEPIAAAVVDAPPEPLRPAAPEPLPYYAETNLRSAPAEPDSLLATAFGLVATGMGLMTKIAMIPVGIVSRAFGMMR